MNLEKLLRKEIHEQLNRVNKKNAPKIYHKLKTKEGYNEIETKIILMVANDSITPSACIPHIESEL